MILKLDFAGDVPIYLQIRNQIVLGVADGQLKFGERLPTIRALASEIGVNTMTVNKAYALLRQEGIIITDRRNGARISECALPQGEREAKLSDSTRDALRLVIAEAKLAGMKKEAFLELCDRGFSDTVWRNEMPMTDTD